MHLSDSLVSSEGVIFTEEELKSIVAERVPKHIAIIMDGNRRWARLKKKPLIYGHYKGAEAFDRMIVAALEIGVQVVTGYSFSTENWGRPSHEVGGLMKILEYYLSAKTEKMVKRGVKFHTIGDLSPLSQKLQQQIQETKRLTAQGTKLELVLAINYGARDDIRRAALKAMEGSPGGGLTEADIGKYLDTAPWGDPELFIRTSGEERLSNFLLWQLSYAELYFTQVLWPEFSPKELLKAIIAYQKRARRWGE